jgi:hypothetical protein
VLKDKTPNEQGGTEKKRGRPKKDAAEGNKEPVPTTKKVTGKASSHFIAPEKENGTTGTGAIDLTLEDEVILPTKRKLNWTPPKNTAPIQAVEHESLSLSTDSPVLKNMTGLLMDFGYIGENSLTSQSGLTGDPALLKRKRIEVN